MLVPRCPLVSVCAPLCVHVLVCMSAGNGGMTVGVQEIYVFKSLVELCPPPPASRRPFSKTQILICSHLETRYSEYDLKASSMGSTWKLAGDAEFQVPPESY